MIHKAMVHRRIHFIIGGILLVIAGCRASQFARVIHPGEREMVGSHQAGQETFEPLIDEAVAKLLGRHCQQPVEMQSGQAEPLPPPSKRVCFVGVENRTAEGAGRLQGTDLRAD